MGGKCPLLNVIAMLQCQSVKSMPISESQEFDFTSHFNKDFCESRVEVAADKYFFLNLRAPIIIMMTSKN